MPHDLPISGSAHPAPHRTGTHQGALWFSVLAAPLGWALRLLVNYSIAGQNCIGAADTGSLAHSDGHLTVILLIDLAATLLAIVAGCMAFLCWRDTRTETGSSTHHLVHSGEGRTRFLAMCGMLSSALFGVAAVIDAFGSILGPPC